MIALEVKDLSVDLGGITVLEDISFTINEGEMAAIIGPNGAGKTTLLRAVLGLVASRNGQVWMFGVPSHKLGKERSRIGYVPQRHDIDRTIPITVEELAQINTPRSLFSSSALKKALVEVDALRLQNRKVGQLSGGELQRVWLALNLLRDPRILFLDEPSTGIDQEGELLFYDVLENLRSTRRLTVIMVSHDLSVVSRYASSVICINRKLMCVGVPGEALSDPALASLFGDVSAVHHHHHD